MSFSIILIMSVQTVGLTGNSVFVVLFFFLFVNSQVLSKRSSLLVSVMCSEWVVKCLCVWKLCTTRMCLVCFAFFSYIFLDRNSNNSSSQHLTLILLLFPKGRLYNRYILHISVPPPPQALWTINLYLIKFVSSNIFLLFYLLHHLQQLQLNFETRIVFFLTEKLNYDLSDSAWLCRYYKHFRETQRLNCVKLWMFLLFVMLIWQFISCSFPGNHVLRGPLQVHSGSLRQQLNIG